jgi:hypothetical protein
MISTAAKQQYRKKAQYQSTKNMKSTAAKQQNRKKAKLNRRKA